MKGRVWFTGFALALLLGGCGRVWVRGEMPGDPMNTFDSRPPYGPTPTSLRSALIDCAKFDPFPKNALERIAKNKDDNLRTFGFSNSREFNVCMRSHGWLSVPTQLYTP